MTEMDIDEIEAATEIDLYDIYRRAVSPKIVFESFGELLVEPSFDPTQNKDHEWRYATVKFGEVSTEKPTFDTDGKRTKSSLGILDQYTRSLASQLRTERVLSDSSQMYICRNCGNVANVIERAANSGRRIRGPYCRLCESSDYVVMVNVPYGAKLLYQELFSMGIILNFDTMLC
ncbi:hypothetical protein Bca4012_090416 [Brassica carinata]|uniref:RNA polymerase Rpb2 domain-containing protein n=2 Tax=Brassica TaxID=3705 RepID=A0ABQ8BHH3_BRANA|nr:hypothetical protein Bca52824_086236 [Brassica carinata]KAH0904287.1 hypothetical protein HID58_043790 [Brassica napus]